ncbi:MAG: hypothetical protein KF819_25550 [Labilithrix sp.]|nr:hypothetical protein [Labilithrix sp.]
MRRDETRASRARAENGEVRPLHDVEAMRCAVVWSLVVLGCGSSVAPSVEPSVEGEAGEARSRRRPSERDEMRPEVELATSASSDPRSDERARVEIAERSPTLEHVSCPDATPYFCPGADARTWDCRERPCPPSCARVGCPSAFRCVDCGAGPDCVPRDHVCK